MRLTRAAGAEGRSLQEPERNTFSWRRSQQSIHCERNLVAGHPDFRLGQISFAKIEEALPAFLTIILIPLTFSITQGILWGFISHVGLYTIVGRWREIHPMMFALSAVAVGLLLLEHVR